MEKDIENRIRRALKEEKPVSEQAVTRMVLLARTQWNMKKQKERIGFSELLLSQFRFIGWKIWIFELITAFLPAFIVIKYMRLQVIRPVRAVFLFSCLTVIISMLWIPFIYRSMHYRMMEIEAAAFFSIRRLLLSRILILFAGELAVITGISAVTSMCTVFSFGTNMAYMLFLFGVCCSGMLLLLRRAETEKLCRYFLMYGIVLLTATMLLGKFMPEFFDGSFQAWMVSGSCILFGYCIYQSFVLVKRPEEITYA